MKKFISILSLLLLLGAGYVAKGQSYTSIENRARAAAHSCTAPYHQPWSTVEVELALIADCFAEGTTGYGFNVWVYYNCAPTIREFCRPAPPTLAAFVYINCEGDVETVTCY